jgi:SAM-dependent methyltransferase
MPNQVVSANMDPAVVESFGQEWQKFDHTQTSELELRTVFEEYFQIFPWHLMSAQSVGFDLGCGSGRWAYFVAPRVGTLYCIDPSPNALQVAKDKLRKFANCKFHLAAADSIPLADGSADFGYSLGVLHHVPDTRQAIVDCAKKLKPGAPLLLYLYYSFENRPRWFRVVWKISDSARHLTSQLPSRLKMFVTDLLAVILYWPLARFAKICELLGVPVKNFPLSTYRNRSFVFMRNDSLDRFGTGLEHRFTRAEIREMMQFAGLTNVQLSGEAGPFWCAVGYKKV